MDTSSFTEKNWMSSSMGYLIYTGSCKGTPADNTGYSELVSVICFISISCLGHICGQM